MMMNIDTIMLLGHSRAEIMRNEKVVSRISAVEGPLLTIGGNTPLLLTVVLLWALQFHPLVLLPGGSKMLEADK